MDELTGHFTDPFRVCPIPLNQLAPEKAPRTYTICSKATPSNDQGARASERKQILPIGLSNNTRLKKFPRQTC